MVQSRISCLKAGFDALTKESATALLSLRMDMHFDADSPKMLKQHSMMSAISEVQFSPRARNTQIRRPGCECALKAEIA